MKLNFLSSKTIAKECDLWFTRNEKCFLTLWLPGSRNMRSVPRIRALRLAKGISLVQLGKHSGLSSGLLSKIERGILIPPLPTLLRIALVFGVGLEQFFADKAKPVMAVVRKQDRLRLPNDPDRAIRVLFLREP